MFVCTFIRSNFMIIVIFLLSIEEAGDCGLTRPRNAKWKIVLPWRVGRSQDLNYFCFAALRNGLLDIRKMRARKSTERTVTATWDYDNWHFESLVTAGSNFIGRSVEHSLLFDSGLVNLSIDANVWQEVEYDCIYSIVNQTVDIK